MNRSRFIAPLILAVALIVPAQAQSISPDSGHYYAGAPYNFISSPPRAGTFYYNDFNRYQLRYFNPGSTIVRYFGGTSGGSGSSKDYSGAAIIGQERGTFTSGATIQLERFSSGSTSKPLNPLDPGYTLPISGDGLPSGTNHTVSNESSNNSIQFYVDQPTAPGAYARFSISTTGYENLQLSFDLGLGTGSSANYRFMASADGGVTWSYTQDFFNGSAGWLEEPLLFDLSSNPEFANNTSFVFQMISIKGQSGHWENVDGRESDDDGSGVGTMNLLFDRVTLSGDAMPVPEPATVASIIGLAVGAFAWHRRRRVV